MHEGLKALPPFTFSLRTKIRFGSGVRSDLPEAVEAAHWKKIGVVIDHQIIDLETFKGLLSDLEAAGSRLTVEACRISEPTYASLDKARQSFADPELDAMIGIGGGSALDMAKAMAVLVHNREPALAYRGFDKMAEPVLPIIAVPTTAGTGSEVTPNASFIDDQAKKKLGINGEAVRPMLAFLDPELTVTCPMGPTVSAAADSVVHAVEAYMAQKTNPMARTLAREGVRRVFAALPRVVENLSDLSAREDVMFGAFLSGLALMHSGTGPAAALSYPLGVHYGVPHGLGGAIFLPSVIEYNIEQGVYDYGDLVPGLSGTAEEMARLFLDRLTALWEMLDIPRDLGRFGLSSAGVETFISDTMELKGALDQNPAPFGEKQARTIVERLINN